MFYCFSGELLATAKAVPSITPVKLFYKKGGVRQAEKDFEALHPTGVKETAVRLVVTPYSIQLPNILL